MSQPKSSPRTAREVSTGPDLSAIDLPRARNGQPLEQGTPIVIVKSGKVRLNGTVVDDTSVIVRERHLRRLDALSDALKKAKKQWFSPPTGIVLAFDSSTPSLVVKSAFQTAAFAGFPEAQFAVRAPGETVARLSVAAVVPRPPDAPSSYGSGARLLINVRSSQQHQLVWWKKGGVASDETVSVAALPAQLHKGWEEYAEHREPGDPGFDQALIYAGDGVDYAGIVAVLDAIHGVSRELAVGGASKRVPALNAILTKSDEMGPLGKDDPLPDRIGLPPITIQRIVRANFDRFRACYDRGLARHRSLAGKVTVRFVIQRDGKVTNAGGTPASTMPDADVVQCVARAFEQLVFPSPSGGITSVVYPIMFAPDEGHAKASSSKPGK